ncbi:hypothetical protein G7B40_031790 [Aetokthonos hydrillicola Thurmond2011]|uniref:Uncharacterized protein n=1 Tax=Aetokthonos hydrillicola Thurmond2011 TaxID=2712845 RepID=A0AAP5ICK9_9CYAN|nr:hypothetical protein [Aetokthonos hydrillicola]MBO3461276.1 hypothetical protein [Aetokthonos hydrillicola CCALA 1050]MDR9899110.1 hypothetical protein [Aetokthonos hydrillicola Thurmond2011]
MQSQQLRAIDFAEFRKNHPLNFLLFYGNYEVINTVYLDDGSPLVDLSLELFNQSDEVVKFAAPPNNAEDASGQNCHFYLNLDGQYCLETTPQGWKVVQESDNLFYFLKQEASDLQPKAANASTNKIVLNLGTFRAFPEGGTRTIRAELIYGPLLRNKDDKQFKDEHNQYFSYGNTIFITNNRSGKKTLPLQVGFAAGNSVLNDGTSTNSLELLIANKNWPSSNLSLSQDSEFVIRFEMGDKAQEGAVATEAQIKNISISTTSSNWQVQHVPSSTEWTVKPKSGINSLASDEAIKLNITNLVTGNSSGSGYLYVRYKNIPNYPDGQFVVPVEKTPLLYQENRVRIGTISPTARLDVAGTADTGEISLQLRGGNNSNNYKSNQITFGYGNTDDYRHAIKTRHNASAKSGNAMDFYVWQKDSDKKDDIGTLHTMTLDGGKVGIGTTSPNLHLSIGDHDTGLQQQGDNQLAIYTANTERMRINAQGNVGIGTTSPSEKLEVNGSCKVVGNLSFGDQPRQMINLWNTSFGIGIQNSTQYFRTSNHFAWYKGGQHIYDGLSPGGGTVQMVINDGNVGIGTTTPSATLDVHGEFHINGKPPIEYRTYTSTKNNPTIGTAYSTSDWFPIVAGVKVIGPPFDAMVGVGESIGSGGYPPFSFLPEVENNKWVIRCNIPGVAEKSWEIRVVFISSKLVKSF